MMITEPNHSLPLMLEAVDELVDLLELQKRYLHKGTEAPGELLERLRLASTGVGELAQRMRTSPPPVPGPEAKALKTKLEQRFFLAFRLTRENEQSLRQGPQRGTTPAPTPSQRRAPREIERCYRDRMRLGSSLRPSVK